MTPQFAIVAEFDEPKLSMRVDPYGLHMPLDHFEMDNQFAGVVIESLLKFMHCFG